MKFLKLKNRSQTIGIAIGLFASFLFILLSPTPVLKNFELATLDHRFKFRPSQKVCQDVGIVFIGDEDIKTVGRFPWSRDYHATLIHILKECEVKVIGFDILFLDPGNPQDDQLLAEATKEAGNVCHCFFFELAKGAKGIPFTEDYRKFSLPAPPGTEEFYSSPQPSLPLKAIAQEAKALGTINFPPDTDGIRRRVPLFIHCQDRLYPTLSLAITASYLGIPIQEIKVSPGKYVELKGIRIPIDKKGCMLVNFAGDIKKFPHYSFVQVLQSYLQVKEGKKPIIPLGKLKNKIILVGITATGTTDLGPTPVSALYPMVGVQANIITNILQQNFLRETGKSLNFLILIFLGLLMGIAIPKLNAPRGALLMFVIIAGYFLLALGLFVSLGICLDLFSPLLVITLSYLAIIFYRFILEGREKRRIKSIFSRYTAPQLIDQLLSRPGEITLGGEKKVVSILFADIRGFTKISESIPPEKVVEILNEVLTIIVKAIFKEQGTLDKFIGDCVMAVYGAPIPQTEHAQRAVRSALEIQKKLKNIEEKWVGEIGRKLEVGIAINSGEAIIGNIGSPERMDYTAIGDTVNLAARLEEFANEGEIVISKNTYSLVKDLADCQEMEPIRVKGKKDEIRIYKVIRLKK